MKSLRIIIASAALLTLATSCLEDKGSYSAGFYFRKPVTSVTTVFANNIVDSVSFISYGRWSMSFGAASGGNWYEVPTTSGNGNTLYTIPIHFTQNTTGEGRSVQLNFIDTDHPDEAYGALAFWQYATRGDGALGSAADVKAITGSDGSRFDFDYDAQHRPTSLRIAKGDTTLCNMTLVYDDYDSLLTVTDKNAKLTCSYSKDYQPGRLIGLTDTVGYYSQFYKNGMAVSANYAFNIEHRHAGGERVVYAILLNGQSLSPDSMHCADSLRIARTTGSGYDIEKYKLTYSTTDNRRQSVDVNQLVFGTEACDPYQLLALFRYARNTSILSSITSGTSSNDITVSSTLNANYSVNTLTVARGDKQTVYTFEY